MVFLVARVVGAYSGLVLGTDDDHPGAAMGAWYGSDAGVGVGIVLADITVIGCVHCLAGDVEVSCSATVGENTDAADAMHAVGDDAE